MPRISATSSKLIEISPEPTAKACRSESQAFITSVRRTSNLVARFNSFFFSSNFSFHYDLNLLSLSLSFTPVRVHHRSRLPFLFGDSPSAARRCRSPPLVLLELLLFFPSGSSSAILCRLHRSPPSIVVVSGFWRIAAINEAGGWKDRITVEDLNLAVRANLRG